MSSSSEMASKSGTSNNLNVCLEEESLNGSVDESWSFFDSEEQDAAAEESALAAALPDECLESLPAQLHPALMRRVSSCYFSLASASVEDDLWSVSGESSAGASPNDSWLFHDIFMNVFDFLDAPSLAAFAETARRPNFECFYYLQLQLQRALFTTPPHHLVQNPETPLACFSLTRLAQLETTAAHALVQEYLDSNSTLHTLPLSHSLAYLRYYLLQQAEKTNPAQRFGAALFFTLLGAASFTAASTEMMGPHEQASLVGLVGGSAAALLASSRTDSMRDAAENMARTMQHHLFSNDNPHPGRLQALAQRMRQAAERVLSQHEHTGLHSSQNRLQALAQRMRLAAEHIMLSAMSPLAEQHQQQQDNHKHETNAALTFPWTPNPYEHFPETQNNPECFDDDDDDEQDRTSRNTEPIAENRKLPSGCVGAYFRVVSKATHRVTQLVQEQRKTAFRALSKEEQQVLSRNFIDACCSDDTLPVVRSLVHCMDVEGFHLGSDGTETCALHAAAFHGACAVLQFLCQGIGPAEDGGCCSVNLQDANGWTAAHFAAGANSPEALDTLANLGANLELEAINGYTPLQWALRLSNRQAADELRRRLEQERQNHPPRHPHLAMALERFFSMIPTPSS